MLSLGSAVLISPERSIIDLRRKLKSIALPCRRAARNGGIPCIRRRAQVPSQAAPGTVVSAEGPPIGGIAEGDATVP